MSEAGDAGDRHESKTADFVDPYEEFGDALLRSIAAGKKPPHSVLEVRCSKRSHRLLSIVKSPDGLVPIPRATGDSASVDVYFVPGSAVHPRTLEHWDGHERLPVSSCKCGNANGPLLEDVREWLRQGLSYVRIRDDGKRAD